MDYILYILIFCIGTLFGSFFTLAVYRIPLGQDITHTRSYCPNCNHKLTFLDMIPILSYTFLGGRCRYCKEKIRVRYILLEILSGVVFVLFAASIKISIFNLNNQILVYFVVGLLYLATLFIIAGIDKERIRIEKPVLLFGFICVTLYMIYLYIVENDASIYRYVIYLMLSCILLLFSIVYLRKKGQDSYTIDVLLLSMLMILYTYETVYIYTVIITLLAISIQLLIQKLSEKKSKIVKKVKIENTKIPIGFYMCVSNIIMLLITNYVIFYRWLNEH